MAGAFNPRTRLRYLARFRTFTSSFEYRRYLLAVRTGWTMPTFSQDRITDAEMPVNSAASPILRCPPEVVAEGCAEAPAVFCLVFFKDALDKQEVNL